MSDIKYLDYDGLVKFKAELEKLRLADKLEMTSALNDVSGDIGNGTLTIKRNNTTLGNFSANLKTGEEINISVPTSISDLGQTAITEILNLINYGQLDVSDLTELLKEALHNQTSENNGLISEDALATELAAYGKIINYDSARLMIQLKNGNTVLSEFDASIFITDGMVLNISITSGTGANAGKSVLLIDFNTDSGITDIEIPLELIFNANNYYTKTQVDSIITSITGESGTVITDETINDSIDDYISDSGKQLSTNDFTNDLKNKLDNIAAGAEANVQSDWNLTNTSADDFIKNKPTVYNLTEIENIIKYGQADVSSLTPELKEAAINNSDYALKAEIPTKTSDLTNDSGFLIAHQDISGKADKATTLSGYGITDAKIELGTITLGNNTITPITLHQSLSNYYTKDEVDNAIEGVDVSSQLADYQLKSEAFSGDYNDLDNKPIIPTSITELTVSGWGFTKNVGTVVGAKVGASGSTISPDANGIITLPEGDANVQADWEEDDSTADSYILNKPDIVTEQLVLSLFDGGLTPGENAEFVTLDDLETEVEAAGFAKSEDITLDYTETPTGISSLDATLLATALRKTAQTLTPTELALVKLNLGIIDYVPTHNIIVSSTEPTSSDGENGDIWIIYKA